MEIPLTPTTAAYVDLTGKPENDDLAVQNSMSNWRVSRLSILLLAAFLITFMSGGLILGFGPLYTLLVDEGQWKELCAAGEELSGVTCARQEVWLQYIFSTAFLCLSLANALFGFLLDIIGPRLCVFIGFVVTFMGNIMLAYGESTVGKGVSIIVGYSCLGIGGYSVYICSFQFVQLFDRQGFVTSTISGLFNAAGYVFMLLHIHGITRRGFFLFYAVFSVACMLVAWVTYPLRSNSEVSKYYTLSGFKWRTPRFVKPTTMWPALKEQFKRPDLWFFGVFFGWISTWFAFAGGAIPNIIYKLAGDDESTADLYVNYLVPLIGNSSFVFTPLVGMVIHKYGFRISFGITTVLVHLFIGFLKINSLHVQIITLLWYSLSQAFFYSLQFAYIIVCFPAEVYGSLQCFLALCSFFMGLLNYAFNPWTQNTLHGNYTDIFIVFAAPVLLFYCFLGLIHKGVKTPEEEKEAVEKEAGKLSVA
ncbi:hypothetical protein FI667_g15389, partial [Globisporangium splendens]